MSARTHFFTHLECSMTAEAEIDWTCAEKVQLVLPLVEQAGVNPSLCFHFASLPPSDGYRFEGPEAYLCCDEQSSDFGKVFILEDDDELEPPMALSEIQQGFGDFIQELAELPFYWRICVNGLVFRDFDESTRFSEQFGMV